VHAGRAAIRSTYRDVTRRKRDEQRIARLGNMYAA
jgi:hypothetical protein